MHGNSKPAVLNRWVWARGRDTHSPFLPGHSLGLDCVEVKRIVLWTSTGGSQENREHMKGWPWLKNVWQALLFNVWESLLFNVRESLFFNVSCIVMLCLVSVLSLHPVSLCWSLLGYLFSPSFPQLCLCVVYTSDAADE